VSDVAADDFGRLRAGIAKKWGPTALGNEIQRVRVLFKFGYDAGLIAQPMCYGPGFKRPSKKTMRLHRASKGLRMFEAAQLRRMIDKAGVQLRAMILLGINCGFGNADVGTLPLKALDLKAGWVNFPRPKTGIDRRCPLWPETVKAIQAAISSRPEPKSDDADGLLFVTKYGGSWAKQTVDNPITKETVKLLKELKLHRPGLAFYALRHTFETAAGESRDQVAVNSIMGHADNSMASLYRERIGDDRLKAVSNHVRKWLFGGKGKKR
jgi:integrase